MLSLGCVATFSYVKQSPIWIFRFVWLIMPFVAGPLFADALNESDRPFQLGVSLGLWFAWAAVLVASMAPRTQTLTFVRIVAPMALVAAVFAALVGDVADPILVVPGVILTGFSAVAALSASVGDAFADGSSYGDETRFLLRTPSALLLGPIQLVWLAIAGGAVAGPLLLLAEQWILGGIALVVGWALAFFAVPVLHRLSDRWLVFVPAGVVVHDKTALREPQLFRKEQIEAFGPAPKDSELEDLSLNGLGLALRARLNEPSKVIRNQRGESVDLTEINGFIVSPNRPGAVVSEAKDRGFAIG